MAKQEDIRTLLSFRPYYKSVLWGGNRISRFTGRKIPVATLGESWEVSDMDGARSVVSGGVFGGMTLRELTDRYGADFLGTAVDASRFPLLVKLIDAHTPLSLQVHPGDELAARLHNSPGKSEMWYILEAEPGARIYCGLKRSITPREFDEMVNAGNILDVVNSFEVSPGEFYDIPAGTLHAIGAGCLIAEIQQPADITYRVYDYDRVDADGNLRPLHVDLARQALRCERPEHVRLSGVLESERVRRVANPYFTVRCITLKDEVHKIDSDGSRFAILMVTQGEVRIEGGAGIQCTARSGETLLAPAAVRHLTLEGAGTVLYVTPGGVE